MIGQVTELSTVEYVGITLVDAGSSLLQLAERVATEAAVALYCSCTFIAAKLCGFAFSVITYTGKGTRLEELQAQISEGCKNSLKSASQSICEKLQQQMKEVATQPEHLRPNWLRTQYSDTWGFSFFGNMTHTLFNRHEEAMQELIELNLICLYLRIKTGFQAKLYENQYFVADLLVPLFNTASDHLEALPGPDCTEAHFHKYFLQAICPNGASDLELYAPGWLQSVLKEIAYLLLQKKILPHIVRSLMGKLQAAATQEQLCTKGVRALTHFVQHGAAEGGTTAVIHTTEHATLTKAVHRIAKTTLHAFAPRDSFVIGSHITEARIGGFVTAQFLPALLHPRLDALFEMRSSGNANVTAPPTKEQLLQELAACSQNYQGLSKCIHSFFQSKQQPLLGGLFSAFFGHKIAALRVKNISQTALTKLWSDRQLLPKLASEAIRQLATKVQ